MKKDRIKKLAELYGITHFFISDYKPEEVWVYCRIPGDENNKDCFHVPNVLRLNFLSGRKHFKICWKPEDVETLLISQWNLRKTGSRIPNAGEFIEGYEETGKIDYKVVANAALLEKIYEILELAAAEKIVKTEKEKQALEKRRQEELREQKLKEDALKKVRQDLR